MVDLVEPIQQLIEKQQLWTRGQRSRQQYQPALAIGKRKERARGELLNGQARQQRSDPTSILGGQRVEGNICAIQTGTDHLHHGVIPTVALVLVLPLRPNITDLVL